MWPKHVSGNSWLMHFVLIGFTLMVILSVHTIFTLLSNLPVDQWTFLKVALLRTKVRWSLRLVEYKCKHTNTSIINTFQSLSQKATVHLRYYSLHGRTSPGSTDTVSRESCRKLLLEPCSVWIVTVQMLWVLAASSRFSCYHEMPGGLP